MPGRRVSSWTIDTTLFAEFRPLAAHGAQTNLQFLTGSERRSGARAFAKGARGHGGKEARRQGGEEDGADQRSSCLRKALDAANATALTIMPSLQPEKAPGSGERGIACQHWLFWSGAEVYGFDERPLPVAMTSLPMSSANMNCGKVERLSVPHNICIRHK